MYTLDEYLKVEIFKGKNFNKFKLIKHRILDPSADAIYLLRSYLVWSQNNSHRLRRILNRKALIKRYGIYISKNASIDIGLKLPHPNGIIFGDYVRLGKNSTVYQQVTFGGKNKGDARKKNYPNSGNGCIFFAGAKILGNINIADGTVVGANSVLLTDSVQYGIYAGVPAKLVGREVKCQE